MSSLHPSRAHSSERLLKTLEGQATACERAGDWEAAVTAYNAIFRESQALGRVDLLADCVRKAARVNHLRGRSSEAVELASLSLEIADRNELPSTAARALNLLGLVEHTRGHLKEAEKLYEVALERAREAADGELIGACCQNLGVLANMRGDLEEARSRYFECMGSVVRSGDRNTAMAIYNNLGMVSSDLGDWLEAEVYFGRGIEIAEQLGERAVLGRLQANYAEPLIRAGEFGEALAALDKAEELALDVDDQSVLSDVARFRGIVARSTGDLAAAAKHLTRALRLAEQSDLMLARAEALEEISLLRHAENRPGPARITAEEALRGYDGLGASRDAERLRARLQEWAEQPKAASALN